VRSIIQKQKSSTENIASERILFRNKLNQPVFTVEEVDKLFNARAKDNGSAVEINA